MTTPDSQRRARMSEETSSPGSKESDADAGATERRLIVAFVVCMLLGLGLLGWHYHAPDKTAPMCGTAEAHCGDKTDPAVQ